MYKSFNKVFQSIVLDVKQELWNCLLKFLGNLV